MRPNRSPLAESRLTKPGLRSGVWKSACGNFGAGQSLARLPCRSLSKGRSDWLGLSSPTTLAMIDRPFTTLDRNKVYNHLVGSPGDTGLRCSETRRKDRHATECSLHTSPRRKRSVRYQRLLGPERRIVDDAKPGNRTGCQATQRKFSLQQGDPLQTARYLCIQPAKAWLQS